MAFRYINVTRATPTIGAYISGVDLNRVNNPAVYEEIRRALWENSVIFFRDQPLSSEAHLKLGQAFGEMEKHEFFPHLDNHTEIQVISNSGAKSPDTDRWHTDCTFRQKPNAVSILRAVDLPPEGGDTMWASMNAAYEAFDEPMKKFLLELDAEHDITHAFRGTGYIEQSRQLDAGNPPYIHPAVINHPVTKKLCLFVNSIWTKRFTDLDANYGDNLLRALFEWVKKPEFHVRFRWEKDSIAIWDNLATQHYAVFDYAGYSRVMNRTTCEPTEVRLDARPNASRPAPMSEGEYGQDSTSMTNAMTPNMSSPSPMGTPPPTGLLDNSRMQNLSDMERRAVKAVFEAVQSLDLDAIARRGADI